MEQNIKFNDLMFKALDHGVASVSKGGALVPFVMTEKNVNRFVTQTLEEGKEQAEKYLLSLEDELFVALAYDGFITVQGKKYEAVLVKAFDSSKEKGVLLAQRYTPKGFLKKFSIVGNPAMIEEPCNPWR